MNINEILDQIERGLNGVTPGPWRHHHTSILAYGATDVGIPAISSIIRCSELSDTDAEGRQWWAGGNPEANAAHIARCDPDTMRAIVAHIRELEAANRHLRGLLWYGWNEMNAIRAESGVPRSYGGTPKAISEEYWSNVVDAMSMALGDDAKPWAPDNALKALEANP